MRQDHQFRAEDLVQRFRKSWPQRSFLARLDQDTLETLAVGRHGTRFAAGETLIHEGETTTDVLMLMSAQVKVTTQLERGTALLAVRVGGDIVGEMAATDGAPRSATVTAVRDDTMAVAIPAEEFVSAINQHPAASRMLASELTRKLRAADRRRADFTAYQVPVRVARVLEEMAEEYGQAVDRKPSVRVLHVGLTQGELATLVGAREASVTEALRKLRAQGILEWGYRTVTIRDIEALRAAGRPPPRGRKNP